MFDKILIPSDELLEQFQISVICNNSFLRSDKIKVISYNTTLLKKIEKKLTRKT